jgi:hypothetical protein
MQGGVGPVPVEPPENVEDVGAAVSADGVGGVDAEAEAAGCRGRRGGRGGVDGVVLVMPLPAIPDEFVAACATVGVAAAEATTDEVGDVGGTEPSPASCHWRRCPRGMVAG